MLIVKDGNFERKKTWFFPSHVYFSLTEINRPKKKSHFSTPILPKDIPE